MRAAPCLNAAHLREDPDARDCSTLQRQDHGCHVFCLALDIDALHVNIHVLYAGVDKRVVPSTVSVLPGSDATWR